MASGIGHVTQVGPIQLLKLPGRRYILSTGFVQQRGWKIETTRDFSLLCGKTFPEDEKESSQKMK